MKYLLSIFILNFAIFAQALVGLPQHGVLLSGDVQHPKITNGAGKEILALNLDFILPSGVNGPLITEYYTHVEGDALHVNETRNLHGTPPTVRNGERISGVVLDSIIFSDGSCVGPDRRHGCRDGADYFVALTQVAAPLMASGDHTTAWTRIQQLASPGARRPPAGMDSDAYAAQRDAARALLVPHFAGKETEAQKLAESLASLPVVHKVN